MTTLRRLAATGLLCAGTLAAFGRSGRVGFVRYEVDDGLSNNAVQCILQDRTGYMWFGTEDGLNRFDGVRFRTFLHNPQDSCSLSGSAVHALCEAPDGALWIGTERGVDRYDPATGRFAHLAVRTSDGVVPSSRVEEIACDGAGRLWFGTQGQGLFCFSPADSLLVQDSRHASMIASVSRGADGRIYVSSIFGRVLAYREPSEAPEVILSGRGAEEYPAAFAPLLVAVDTLWFGGREGVIRAPRRAGAGACDVIGVPGNARVRCLFRTDEGTLLAGSDAGLFRLDGPTGRLVRMDEASDDAGLSDNIVNAVYRDRERGIWIATQYGGVNYLSPAWRNFERIGRATSPRSIGGRVVTCFAEDGRGDLWIGTEDAGLFRLDGRSGDIRPAPFRLEDPYIRSLLVDGDRLWVGTHASGLCVAELSSGRVRSYRHRRGDRNALSDDCVTALCRDAQGVLYAGTPWGLCRYDAATDRFVAEPRLGNQADICDIHADARGNLWFATRNGGLYRHRPDEGLWRQYLFDRNNPRSLPANRVVGLFERRDGELWISTEGGLCRYDAEADAFDRLRIAGMDADQPVLGIAQDAAGDLWLTDNAGLMRVDARSGRVTGRFTERNGLQGGQFSPRAIVRTCRGEIYLGGIRGLDCFRPDALYVNPLPPRVVLTRLSVNNRPVAPGEPESPLERPLDHTREVTLSAAQNSFSIDFAALSYLSPRDNRYAYRLEGIDRDWVEAGDVTTASYAHLAPGEYLFRVRAANGDGLWSDGAATLRIVVLPPFYRTVWAWALYLLLAAGTVYALLRFWAGRMDRSHRLRMREYAMEQEKRAYQSKIDFFTNLAHEIRTPLSLIRLPLESIIRSGDGTPRTRHYLRMIDKNACRLQRLVDQLLDFRKAETAGYRLFIGPCDLSALLGEIAARFRPALRLKGILLVEELPEAPFTANVDCEALTKIVSNLLSNGAKYASSRIALRLRSDDAGGFALEVADDGPGVRAEERAHVFEAFYQPAGSRSGTGIGLSLVRMLAAKHGGRVELTADTELGGACFTLHIPPLEAPADDAADRRRVDVAEIVQPFASSLQDAGGEAPQEPSRHGGVPILLVDDNEELLRLLADDLGRYYDVATARNGIEALDELNARDVALVVTDLMMPSMDGYTLCRRMKEDMRYCHIPVIQLTARATLDDRLRGLASGADAYIEKPFSSEHLHTQIANLLDNRRRLREAYNASPEVGRAEQLATSQKDCEFIGQLNGAIAAHLAEEGFRIETLAETLCMSRSNFYRKIRSLFGMPPNEYLRSVRMKHAATLLRRGGLRVNEVYAQVGFSSPSYFSKCFKEHFGLTPKEFCQRAEAGASAGSPGSPAVADASGAALPEENPAAADATSSAVAPSDAGENAESPDA